tara:strand:- start:372 stop:599 length:228 start_codon:yes stop_codon:yes gene_type:complete
MIQELFYMNGYGFYVWLAFIFTFLSFSTLYLIIRFQHTKERNKFISKYGALDSKKAEAASSHKINKEILSSGLSI